MFCLLIPSLFSFLLQALEARLIGLYHDVGRFQEALADGARLLKELKKLDDKNGNGMKHYSSGLAMGPASSCTRGDCQASSRQLEIASARGC